MNEHEEERQVEVVDEAAAIFGLMPMYAEQPPQPVYLWPCNVLVWNLFQAVSTQWNRSEGRATGLNYPGVEVVMRKWRIKRSEEQRIFSELQQMEVATLKAWNELSK